LERGGTILFEWDDSGHLVWKGASFKTFPHCLYQWSTIGSDNELVNPKNREILIPGHQLQVNQKFEL